MKSPPLIQRLIPILHEDASFLAVDKPARVDAGGLRHETTARVSPSLSRPYRVIKARRESSRRTIRNGWTPAIPAKPNRLKPDFMLGVSENVTGTDQCTPGDRRTNQDPPLSRKLGGRPERWGGCKETSLPATASGPISYQVLY